MSFKLNSFFNLTETQIDKIYEFQKLMIFWNERINLISRKDIDNFIINHVIHSLSISCFFNFNDNTKILDFGTGGGLPGIPLSICFPNVKFHLVDSIKKKIDVVNKITMDLNLKNVEVTWSNVKNINKNYDFIVSRAVAKYPKIKSLCLNKFSTKNFNNLPCKSRDNSDTLSKKTVPLLAFSKAPIFCKPFRVSSPNNNRSSSP